MQRASHVLCRIIGPAVTPGLCVLVLHLLLASPGLANSRLKNIADFEGVRDNLLVGYGLVVGLDGTGDSLRNSAFTEESLKAMLERLGVSTRGLGRRAAGRNRGDVMSDTSINPGPAPVAARPAGADTPRVDSMPHTRRSSRRFSSPRCSAP